MSQRIDIQQVLVWAFRVQKVETAASADPDAMTVYWAVLALPVPHATLIRRYAREARRPDWHAADTPTVSLEGVRRLRRLYTEWVRALVVLQRTLEGTLSRFHVTGPCLDEQPWLRERLRA
ncbi:MAG: hypothetical protein JWQ89_3923 [Devosia sp.]|uniref:hypothetical protein n=1 Tax=Devosia sp. TaxID=1871048 RepID=UPI0026019C3C|nr:hypothetical protein [Devosia sp.]MDB5542196.1 hypothetical protein [Devosia sp.]